MALGGSFAGARATREAPEPHASRERRRDAALASGGGPALAVGAHRAVAAELDGRAVGPFGEGPFERGLLAREHDEAHRKHLPRRGYVAAVRGGDVGRVAQGRGVGDGRVGSGVTGRRDEHSAVDVVALGVGGGFAGSAADGAGAGRWG